ncbi:micrococcal nuclease-like nuclease [Rivularia sp. PCC 7116]|uniref:thermonuclease family protein n=1 Tax=Rivularia sp. PCC 7116 TaxID=373994 RepID=UPI00029ED655|nr:thermonuclease family protein [Rivularia sp. PCC 7116]AFY57602.1 micrococcal nuclease-like nuclease [Rivularia sp. PCC 7116]
MTSLTELMLILATVVGVVDGETIRAKNVSGQVATVKMACIHIPTRKSRRDEANQRLKQLLPNGNPIVIRFADTYKESQIVGEVFLNNKSINLQMVKEGKAVVDKTSVEQNCYESRIQYLVAEANAKQRGLGLWEKSRYVMK